MSKSTVKSKSSKLNQSEIILLSDWLRTRRKNADWNKCNAKSLAGEATVELKFPVTDANLRSLAKAASIEVPTTRGKSPSQLRNPTRAKLARLRAAIVYLFKKLGEPVPSNLSWEPNTSTTARTESNDATNAAE